MSGYTGLKIENHPHVPERKVIVYYQNDERVATVYLNDETLVLVHESKIRVEVHKRVGFITFEAEE